MAAWWAAGAALVSAFGAYEGGQSQAAAANYQAQVARNNQQIAQQNAAYAQQRGQIMEQQKRQQTAQVEGHVRAAAGAAGIDTNRGSPVRIQSDVAKVGEFDAMTIRNAAAREAYGYTVQGLSFASEAGLEEMKASSAAQGGELGALSSLISAGGQISSKWGSMFGSAGDISVSDMNNPSYIAAGATP